MEPGSLEIRLPSLADSKVGEMFGFSSTEEHFNVLEAEIYCLFKQVECTHGDKYLRLRRVETRVVVLHQHAKQV